MRTIGLTGGIASGKSAVVAVLREEGATVLDADAVAHALMRPGQVVWQNILDHFGAALLQPDGSVDRARLGDIVFQQEDKRRLLNTISHPHILQALEDELSRIRREQPRASVFADIPLLFEVGWESRFEQIWTVWVDQKTQLARLTARDHLDEAAAAARIAAQMSLDEKARCSHCVIDNSSAKTRTAAAVRKFYQAILAWSAIS
jgi:dephospho-CoA kinase